MYGKKIYSVFCHLCVAAVVAIATGIPAQAERPVGEFNFARIQYDTRYPGEGFYWYDGRGWERWETDFPVADENFAYRLTELSEVTVTQNAMPLRLTDDDVAEFPFLYLCDAGFTYLDPEEVTRLREYLRSGGFLWADDFWGDTEWQNFESLMVQVLPEYSWRDIPLDHPILKIAFDLSAVPQVPARGFAEQGWTHDPPWIHKRPTGNLKDAHFRGWFDADGRLMVLATHNSDNGDGWEREAYGQWYFEKYSTKAYMLGVNIVLYVLTH